MWQNQWCETNAQPSNAHIRKEKRAKMKLEKEQQFELKAKHK